MANTGLTAWYPLEEAAVCLSDRAGVKIHRHDLLGAAFTTRLPLVVCVPSGTKDSEGRPIDEGLWDLLLEGSWGQQARQQFAHEISSVDSIANVDGMWVEKGGKRRQLRPAGYPDTRHGVIPDECVLGVLETVLDDFSEKLKHKLPPRLFKESPTPPAPKSELVSARWEDVTITFTSEFQVQILVGDKSHVVTYADLGFRDERQDKPTLAWEKFRELAEAKSQRIDLPQKKDRKSWERETGDKERVTIQQRVKEIRTTLQAYFKREGYEIPSKTDPLPHDKKHNCYTPTFSIKLTHSYGSTPPQ